MAWPTFICCCLCIGSNLHNPGSPFARVCLLRARNVDLRNRWSRLAIKDINRKDCSLPFFFHHG